MYRKITLLEFMVSCIVAHLLVSCLSYNCAHRKFPQHEEQFLHELIEKNELEIDRKYELVGYSNIDCNVGHFNSLRLASRGIHTIPNSIGTLVNVREIELYGNNLTNLPSEIVNLELRYLGVDSNSLCSVNPDINNWIKKFDVNYLEKQKCDSLI